MPKKLTAKQLEAKKLDRRRKQMRERMRIRRAKCRRNGICTVCTKRKVVPKLKYCRNCRARIRGARKAA